MEQKKLLMQMSIWFTWKLFVDFMSIDMCICFIYDLENLVNTDMGIDSLLEHRYCWFPKTLEMFQTKEKDSPRPEKALVVCADACKQGLGRVPDRAIGQIKVQRKHCGPKEVTWELEDSIRLAHPFFSILQSTKGGSNLAFC